jgi:long-subunit acyl-CoA synthetase (AMP-forming)
MRGNNVVAGYSEAPEITHHAFHGGWFHAGDTSNAA